MTPISSTDQLLVDTVTSIVREADRAHESTVGGSTRHWVKELLLPMLEKHGICFCTNDPIDKSEPSKTVFNQEKINERMQELQAGTSAMADISLSPGNPLKPFLMIDINAIKDKQYTIEEITKIFEQSGISILHRNKTVDMTWGEAIEALKGGHRLARIGWNGRGMFVYYVPANLYPSVTEVAKKTFGIHTLYNAYFAIKNPDGNVSTWVPSVSDNLAYDWYIVE